MEIKRNRELEAKYYDSEYTFQEDIALYLKMAGKIEGEVLELGCGTGRVIIPFAEAGYSITGLDISELMLEKAEGNIKILTPKVRSRITLVKRDMRTFSLKKRFHLVFVLFNVLFMMERQEEQKKLIARIYRHLASGGRVIISTINPNYIQFREKIPEVKYYGTWEHKETGKYFDRFYYNSHDPLNRLMTFDLFYDTIKEDGTVQREKNIINLRYLYSFELQYLLEQAGFSITRIFGSYEGGPFQPESRLMIFEAQRDKERGRGIKKGAKGQRKGQRDKGTEAQSEKMEEE